MGWHRKKSTKQSVGEKSEEHIENQQNIQKTAVTRNGKTIQTLLAKALYDNLADAPDELSFRKGDIVTVIEQDVDGLIGWWLCLLHGSQGIVPGNRLKVIPPVELDQFEKDTKKPVSNDSTDFVCNKDAEIGHNYDFLPAPVKVNNYPSPLSIKDMFDIPYKTDGTVANEVYDVPANRRLSGAQEIYDTPSNAKDSIVQEIYDTPTNSKRGSANLEVYDTPSSRRDSGLLELYDTPSNKRLSGPQEIYDVPSASHSVAPTEIYDTPTGNKSVAPTEIYNTPISRANSTQRQEIYDTPRSRTNSTNRQEIYDIPKPENKITKNISDKSGPKASDVDKLMEEFYDSPFNHDSNVNTIKRSPRNSMNASADATNVNKSVPSNNEMSEIYDVPKAAPVNSERAINETNAMKKAMTLGLNRGDVSTPNFNGQKTAVRTVFEETYDVPVSAASAPRIGPQSKLKNTTPAGARTLPRGFSPRAQQQKATRLQEIYDIPTTTFNRSPFNSAPSTPMTERKPVTNSKSASATPTAISGNSLILQSEEVYDVPSSKAAHQTSQEIYDTPPNNTLRRSQSSKSSRDSVTSPQDVYDVPSNHNLKEVMANVSSAYSSHLRGNRGTGRNLLTPEFLEDDYVDYHDIWSNEPPKELVREHANSISQQQSELAPPLSPTTRRRLSSEQKKSILDQINFEAVKELQITTSEALERLGKLHLAVDTCVKTLISFCHENWLDVQVLKQTIQPIRDFSGKLKTALRLLTEFGLGTLVNTTKNINGEELMDKLIGDVEPLLESYYKVKICLMHLDSNHWMVPDVRTSSNDKFFATLNAIMILSQRIPDQCRIFNLSVQNNIHELFNADDSVQNITKKIGDLLSQTRENSPSQMNSTTYSASNRSLNESPANTNTMKRDLAGRRQQARVANTGTSIPILPPKPVLPSQRRSMAGVLEPPDPRYCMPNRGIGHIERLVTDYLPDDTRQRKYASDPATPSHTDGQKTMWGGSCPILLERNSAAPYSPLRGADSTSSSSSVGASIPEESIEIKQTNFEANRSYPSDSNILSPVLTPLHTRSASLPWDDKLKNTFTFDDCGPKSPQLSPLDHRDIESLEFFCRQVESQVLLLREAMKNLTEAVENREEPAVFVSHSKFIILTAHKVVGSGQEITNRLLNKEVLNKLKSGTVHLTVCIRGVVSSTKSAALEYPEPSAMMEMISSVLALGDAVRIIHSECRRALTV